MQKILLFFLIVIFFLAQPAWSEMAQEITIPGLSQTTPAPATSSTHTTVNAQPAVTQQTIVTPVEATTGQLQQLIQSVDLSVWGGVASYLWTCTPRYFMTPLFDAKNEMQNRFNKVKQKEILTYEKATHIAAALTEPESVKIPGLSGIMCRLNITASHVEKPYTLTCLFIMLDARYLSRLLYDVSQENGKPQVVPQATVDAIQKLLDANCTKQSS